MAEGLHPEVDNPIAGATGGGSAAGPRELVGANSHLVAHAGEQCGERETLKSRAYGLRDAAPDLLDEGAAAQNPPIAQIRLAPPTERGERSPNGRIQSGRRFQWLLRVAV